MPEQPRASASQREIWTWVIGLWILGALGTTVVLIQGWTWVTVFDTPGIAIGTAPFLVGFMMLALLLRKRAVAPAPKVLRLTPKPKLKVSAGAFLSMVFGGVFVMLLVEQLAQAPWEERTCALSAVSPGNARATYAEGQQNLSFATPYAGTFPSQMPCYVVPGQKKRGRGTLTRPTGEHLPLEPLPNVALGLLTLAAVGVWQWQRRRAHVPN